MEKSRAGLITLVTRGLMDAVEIGGTTGLLELAPRSMRYSFAPASTLAYPFALYLDT